MSANAESCVLNLHFDIYFTDRSLRLPNYESIGFSDEECSELFVALQSGASRAIGRRLERLDLTGHDLRSEGCEELVRVLEIHSRASSRLRSIQLRSNKIGDRGATSIADFLEARNTGSSRRSGYTDRGPTGLLTIDLAGNQISFEMRKKLEQVGTVSSRVKLLLD